MPEEFELSPDDDKAQGYAHWVTILQTMVRTPFDTPTAPMQSAEFWIDGGSKPKRDIEKMELAENYAQLAQWELNAPCNLTSLAIEEAETFVSVATQMSQAYKTMQTALEAKESQPATPKPDPSTATEEQAEEEEDESTVDFGDDDFALAGVILRKSYEGGLDLTSPEQYNAYHELPYALRSQADLDNLAEVVSQKNAFIIKQRHDNKQAGADYRDYGFLVKLFRQGDPERLLAGAKSVNAPYFMQQLLALIDSSAAGSSRPHSMALIARLIADVASGTTQNVADQRRHQGGGRSRRSSQQTEDTEA